MALNKKAFAAASAVVTALLDVFGYLWHGMLQQPSIMNVLYPGFWSDWTLMLLGLVATVAGAYIFGYAFAWVYNKYERKK